MINKQEITLIYIYRDLDTTRVKRSLTSLHNQNNKNFSVIFIDYGSRNEYSSKIKEVLKKYKFCVYKYVDTSLLPWSRAHALNIGISNCNSEYIFTADVDIIFKNTFIEKLHRLKKKNLAVSFQVAYLSKNNKEWSNFNKFKINYLSEEKASGMSLFHLEDIKEISGYDEKFIYWGGEDNDVINRLKNKGVKYYFYDDEIYLYHQWHKVFYDSNNRFPEGINDFLISTNVDKIFQKNRPVGSVLKIDYSVFKEIKIKAFRFGFINKMSTVLIKADIGDSFCFEVVGIKNDEKYYRGKTYYIKRVFSKYFKKINLVIKWKNHKNNILYLDELKPLIINFILSNTDRYELMGLIEKKEDYRIYIKKTS